MKLNYIIKFLMLKIFIIMLLIILLIIFFRESNKHEIIDKFNNMLKQMPNKIIFNLKTQNGLNFIFHNNNFYITNQPAYTFVGELDVSGLYLLKNTLGTKNMTLNYNTFDTSYSKIILQTPLEDNLNANTISNLFNPRNPNIYFDPVNKIIMSNDNSGTQIYLTNQITGSPVSWNYNINNATIFDIFYV